MLIFLFLTSYAGNENKFYHLNNNYSHAIFAIHLLEYLKMFDINEVNLMFIDPLDLFIDSVNNYLSSNKAIKIIFS